LTVLYEKITLSCLVQNLCKNRRRRTDCMKYERIKKLAMKKQKRLWDWLVGANPRLVASEDTRGARLFTILMFVHIILVISLIIIINIIWKNLMGVSIWDDKDAWVVLIGVAIIIIALVLVKTGFYRLGVLLYIITTDAVAIIAPFVKDSDAEIGLLATAIIPILLAAMVFSYRWVLAILIGTIAVAVPQLIMSSLPARQIGTGFSLLVAVSVTGSLILVFRYYFSGLEIDRLAKIRESEEKLKSIFESSPDAIVVCDLDIRIIDCNQKALNIFGGPIKKELIGKSALDFIIPKDRQRAIENFRKRIEQNFDKSVEYTLISKDGHEFPAEISAGIILDASGNSTSVIVIVKDLTEKKQTEEAYRAVVEGSLQGTIVFQDQHIAFVNPAAARISGYDTMDLIGKSIEEIGDLIHPDDRVWLWQNMIQQLEKLQLEHYEYRVFGKDGNIRWMSAYNSIIQYHSKPAIQSAIIDITEQKQAEEALRSERDKAQNYLDLAGTIFLAINIDQTVSLINKSGCQILGYSEEEIIGKNWFDDFLPKEKIGEVKSAFNNLINGNVEPVTHYENPILTKDGNIKIIAWHNTILRDKSDNVIGTLSSGMDVTERKQAEILQAKLQQTSKMESIGRLAGGVAHDFNNLLTVIQGSSSLGMNELSKNDPIYERLKLIDEAAQRAAELTRQLLAFSRKQIIEMKVINLNRLINNLQKMLIRLIGEDIELQTILSNGIDNISADSGQIEQIVVNLVVNARDAMPEGGKLTIETSNVELDEIYCKQHVNAQPGTYVMLTICDNGIGMDEKTKEHIFEPFFTTKESGEGTGLGLATVYGIVKQHNGSLELYSELGHGTTFKIYLPIVKDEESALPEEIKKDEVITGNETILVVEDEDILREMAVEFLKSLGYNVLSAENGGTALMISEQHKGMIHLMLTDVVMPNMNGRQLAERLQKEHPEMNVLYTSGYTEDIIVHHGILDSGLNFIGKPYRLQALAKKIRELLSS
jgi:PAS domain S-box-containing protein